ncbi:gluconate 2-dehydrogenase subunit 3 family protein [Massilia solisilvae]|uniref:Gluconate 2-dehydrogenase subunit 3 family protein n=1 Tax=Massilia solisilvae TaxID=1811225 RepID=A0ABT2BIP5_9BURK|nr:gluconate 2-dehydrogenase subunit 3 family protein [Massilia solisilvae]MCS0608378.1 gluconate 2-dehydrogenase subunit 3 family protein [Massilia solisilvae]
MTPAYPGYQVLDKWNSVSFDDTTRTVLRERLDTVPPRRFFREQEWRLLDAIVARVLPQPDRSEPVPITPWIDAQLHDGVQEGFRYANMPPQAQAWRGGLAAIEAEARYRHDLGFCDLPAALADDLLAALERDQATPGLWPGMNAQCFFITVLAKTIVGFYYAHPAAWSEIGFGGPASPRGYVRLGFDQRDAWEAKEAQWNPE